LPHYPCQSPLGNITDDLNQHRHEHGLSRGSFLGEGFRGYRRRIRGGAADREPTAEDGPVKQTVMGVPKKRSKNV